MLLRCEINPAVLQGASFWAKTYSLLSHFFSHLFLAGICSFPFLRYYWICSLHIYFRRLLSCISTGAPLFSSLVLPVMNSFRSQCTQAAGKLYSFWSICLLFSTVAVHYMLVTCQVTVYRSLTHVPACGYHIPTADLKSLWGTGDRAVQFDARWNRRGV